MDLNATIIGQSISFVLFIWFCMKYIWPNIINIIEKRQQEIDLSILNIENSRKQIEVSKIHANDIINKSQKKANLIIEEANKKRLAILENAKLYAKREKNRIILQAEIEINIKKEKIKHELLQEISKLSIMIAKKIITGSIKNTSRSDDLIKKSKINL